MARKTATARKGGTPRKATGGLDKVLFIRADQKLLDRLEDLRRRKSEESRGIVLSTADIARSILWDAVDRDDKEKA
jgi:hypothetical protein